MDRHPGVRPDPIRILVVCTANRCRSPVAEVLLWRALVLADVPAVVRSAGFLESGHPVDETTRQVMAERGVDLSGHRSTQIADDHLEWADLILTMERRHARELVVLAGRELPVATFAGYGDGATPGVVLVGDVGDDEIPDPIGRPAAFHREVVRSIEEAASRISPRLRGERGTGMLRDVQ
jgi:protein-tyrosine phosphatase